MSGTRNRSLAVREIAGPNGGIDPDRGVALAEQVVEYVAGRGESVAVDFAGVGAISSGFANAFFLKLGETRPIDEWRSSLTFVGLDDFQQKIIRSSLMAARDSVRVR